MRRGVQGAGGHRRAVWAAPGSLIVWAGAVSVAAPSPVAAQEGGGARVERIVGGSETEAGRWPWMVAVATRGIDDLRDAQFCGGTLIHPYWVVSAAHCFEGETAGTVDVVFGLHRLSQPGPGVLRVDVAEIIPHPSYNRERADEDGDIALLRLARPVTEFAPLPLVENPGQAGPGVTSKVLGWGLVIDGGSGSDVLREVDLPIVSLETAAATGAYAFGLTPDMLAAGFAQGGRDSCEGDSGGPLIVPDGGGGWRLAGVVSFGSDLGCAAPDAYGIYARVSHFLPWIDGHLNPGFAAWAARRGTAIDLRGDPDGDGLTNLLEYALGSDPARARPGDLPLAATAVIEGNRFGTFAHRRRVAGSHNLAYRVESSTDLATWFTLDPETHQVGAAVPVEGDEAIEEHVFRGAHPLGAGGDDDRVYFRLAAAPGDGLEAIGYAAESAFVVHGTLGAGAPADPDRGGGTFFIREFRLDGLVPGEPLDVRMDASGFTPYAAFVDDETGAVLSTFAGVGSRLEFTFTPEDGVRYRLRLSSAGAGASGTFSFEAPPFE